MNLFTAKRNQLIGIPSLLVLLLLLGACVKAEVEPLSTVIMATPLPPEVKVTPHPSETRIAPLTEIALRNGIYQGIFQEAVQLTDGTYSGALSVEGNASRPTVTFTGRYTFGDLNSDGGDDAVVILVD